MNFLNKKLVALKCSAHNKLSNCKTLTAKKPGEKTIIMEIVIIVIGVAVAIIFKDKIVDIVSNLADKVESNISGIFGTT